MYFSKFERIMVDFLLHRREKARTFFFRKQKDKMVVLRQLDLLQTY